ncbi:primosome assembly protein PriA, partial [Staphylococcus aureus]
DAFVVEVVADDGTERPLSSVESVVSTMPVLPERLFALARKVADRAAGSVSDVLRLAVPKRMVRAEKAWLAAPVPETPVVPAESLARADTTL